MTDLGLDDLHGVVSLDEKSHHASDHAKRSSANDSHDGRDHRVEEGVRLELDRRSALLALKASRRELVNVVGRVEEGRIADRVERIKGRYHEGEEGEGLLGGEVAEGAGEDALALEDGDEGDEGVGDAGANA